LLFISILLFSKKIEFLSINLLKHIKAYYKMLCGETSLDLFLCEIDKAISSGNIIYIENAIKKYKNVITKHYITWAQSITLQIIEEKLEDILI